MKILELHEKKKQLASGALSGDKKALSKLDINDLKQLFAD